ncbi:pilus assembly protein TadG-related protein [Erythrobacter sp. THAF29]|uniref:pilus assembly protein TadG-related protein n=1 Tax=Erythrobacter sp. THAF29 TaxID=2587851 RepID=UPI0012A95419|nr:pilus assembly protein TadG-related protein [Erythrobacter sp. THAF29]QFT77945.1 hypothetical protein FIU90_10395 [Erythrobacter sp. THAF29]
MDMFNRKSGEHQKSFWRGLAEDPTANTIVIAAAALVPLLAMVGGGVDASRYYMAESRLQAACDAGALAARRAMADDTFTDEHKNIGLAFFDQNYEDGLFGLTNRVRNYTADNEGKVTGTATGDLPTSLMGIFGYDEFNLSVDCTADINISNTDIVFVLDVTGSMNCAPDNPGGGSCGNTEDPGSKIGGLRSAVMAFYDTVEDATSDSAQVRYGIVPYASNVNVGDSIPDQYMAQSHTYQSRVANFQTVVEWTEVSRTITNIDADGDEDFERWDYQWQYTGSESSCDALLPDDWTNVTSSLGTHNQQNIVVNGNTRTVTYLDGNEDIEIGRAFTYYTGGWCAFGWRVYEDKADVTFETVEEYSEREVFQNWTYRPVTFDLATLYDDDQIELPLGSNGTDTPVSWDGCVEEADTVATATWDPTPGNANDLNINLQPSGPSEYWKPVLRNAVWKREDGGNTLSWLTQSGNENRPSYSCPRAAMRLTDLSRTDLNNYVNSLQARSNTYHDIGMIWGARFISPNGIFSADNATAPNGDSIARHIIFMTDGMLVPNVEVYGTYGVEWWDRRVTDNGSSSQASDRHAKRFQAACRAARQQNVSVWVIAFGTTLTQNLIDCATPGRAFKADDADELRDQFEEIAQRIAALRLTS